MQTIHITDQMGNLGLNLDDINGYTTIADLSNSEIFINTIQEPVEIIKAVETVNTNQFVATSTPNQEQPCIFQIVYPQELNLAPAYTCMKRGRPRKKESRDTTVNEESLKTDEAPPKSARTRSGRLVKLPKHIEKNFKKIDVGDESDIQVTDFQRFEEPNTSKQDFQELQARKRTISAQFRCPKCRKAYLGKNRMIEHLKKYPDHGPLPETNQEFNFHVWNYLYDSTQKCKSGQRGAKFCDELSNLLHNVQLLKSALFKPADDAKSCVNVDKVLGNAIGLAPGRYKFDENELYRDVTILKLFSNSDFFRPSKEPTAEELENKLNSKKFKPDEATIERESRVIKPVSIPLAKTDEIGFPEKVDIAVNRGEDYRGKMSECNEIALNTSDILSENLLLHPMLNEEKNNICDGELLLTGVENGANLIDAGTSLLDNSTSSDEVMNVDQFVNERFKKILEPDIDLTSHNPLNLELGFFPCYSS